MAGWYGTGGTPLVLYPFVLTAGGLAQFLAGMWSYRARDGLATAVHGIWGSFWLAFGGGGGSGSGFVSMRSGAGGGASLCESAFAVPAAG